MTANSQTHDIVVSWQQRNSPITENYIAILALSDSRQERLHAVP